MTPQLPTPGGDDGTWGNILNNFLSVAHTSNGGLQPSAITAAGGYILPGGGIPATTLDSATQAIITSVAAKYTLPSGGIPSTDLTAAVQTSLGLANSSVQLGGDLGGSSTAPTLAKLQGTPVNASVPTNNQVLTFSSTSNAWVPGTVTSSTVNDATTSSKGIVALSGDLGGTASSPTVLKLNGISVSGTPATNQVLTATSTTSAQWTTPASGSSTLAADSDVSIAGPATNQVLAYNGIAGKWQNATLTESDVTSLTNDLANRVQLGGDLGGTATSPKVVSLNGGITLPGSAPSAAGQVLTTTSTGATASTAWTMPSSAPVSSVFGRAGAVVATSGDYTAAQVGALASSDDLSAIASANPTAGTVSMNAHKITNVANGATAQDAAAFGQLPVAGSGITNTGGTWSVTGTAPIGTASGDLSGTYPSPTVARVNGVSVSGTASNGKVLTASSSSAASWQAPAALEGTLDWLNVVTQYGADPTGTNDSTTAIQNAITAAINGSGNVVYLPSGTYKVTGNLSANISGRPIYIKGDGWDATVISFTGSGDCFRIYCPNLYSTDTVYGQVPAGGEITGMTIDGTSHTGTGASGIHVGDVFQYHIDITVRDFSAASDKGVHLDNNYYWAEQTHGRIYVANCTAGVVFDNSANTSGQATGSFDRSDLDIFIDQEDGTFDGTVFQNGAVLVDGKIGIYGNFATNSNALTSAVLRITGTGGGSASGIVSSVVNIGVELGGGLAYAPQTIYFGSGSNGLSGSGVIDFGAAETFASSNNGGQFYYQGYVTGDANLPCNLSYGEGIQGTVNNGTEFYVGYAAVLAGTSGSSNVTGLTMPAGFTPGQMVSIINQGTGSMTFATSGTSRVAGGTATSIPPLSARSFVWDTGTSLWYGFGA